MITKSELERHVRVLDIDWPAPKAVVRTAYKEQVSVWHPDRFGEGKKARAEEQMKRINAAHAALIELLDRGLGRTCDDCGELLDARGDCAACNARRPDPRVDELEAEVERLREQNRADDARRQEEARRNAQNREAHDRSRQPVPEMPLMPVPPPQLVGPGRWRMRMTVFGIGSDFDLLLLPNGALQGSQAVMGITAQIAGQWAFDGFRNVLQLMMMPVMMGMPIGQQDLLVVQLTGQHGASVMGRDMIGRGYELQRVG